MVMDLETSQVYYVEIVQDFESVVPFVVGVKNASVAFLLAYEHQYFHCVSAIDDTLVVKFSKENDLHQLGFGCTSSLAFEIVPSMATHRLLFEQENIFQTVDEVRLHP